MLKLPENVVKFASNTGTKTQVFDKFKDYYCHYMSEMHEKKYGPYMSTTSFAQKDKEIHALLLSEVKRISGVTFDESLSLETYATNPAFRWATFAYVSAMIDAIMPLTIIDSIGLYTEMKGTPFGQDAVFTVAPKTLFTVSEGGNAQRHSFVQKQSKTTTSIKAVNHNVTVEVELYRVLAGLESLAEFTRKAIISAQTAMTRDAYDAFRTGLNAVTVPSKLTVTGYSQDSLLRLCQTVTAYNQGAKAVIVGTARAMQNIMPDQALGHRIVSDANNISIQLVRNFIDYDLLILPQVATGDFTTYDLALKDDELYVISPSSDKLVKGVIEGQTLTNTDDTYANANLTQAATLNMRWGFEWMSAATAGIVKGLPTV